MISMFFIMPASEHSEAKAERSIFKQIWSDYTANLSTTQKPQFFLFTNVFPEFTQSNPIN